MKENLQLIDEIIVGSAAAEAANLLTRLKRKGRVVRLAPRLYTTNLTDSPENIVRRNLWTIVGKLWPEARLSYRTAFEYAPHEGHIFLGYKYTRKVNLPGVVVHLVATPKSLPSDYPFMAGLGVSSQARAILENLEPDRTQGGVEKCRSSEFIEERLEAEFATGGEAALNKLRDEAREIAATIGLGTGFSRLDKLIGALLSTRSAKTLKSAVARARVAGEPFDSSRMELFGVLLEKLAGKTFPIRAESNVSDDDFATFAFFESYFSNYIEGTTFELEEAWRIVESGVAIPTRDADSHDVLGTYAIASNRSEMSRRAESADEFLGLLQARHRVIMSGRPTFSPGLFKTQNNRAGDTHFVTYDRVRGTLKRGFDMSRAIRHPFARAVFIFFVTSEVHPFADGNGRISRIMMNAELTAAGQTKIIVPTVFRPDYIGALRKLSRDRDPEVLIAAMSRLWEYGQWLSSGDFETLKRRFEESNAFSDSMGTILKFEGLRG